MITTNIISNFTKRFETEEELKTWLKRQSKDYLYNMYMQDTNFEGVSHREITRNKLKEIFIKKYKELQK